MARNDASPKVRGQALFWLAQKAQKFSALVHQMGVEDFKLPMFRFEFLVRQLQGVLRLLSLTPALADLLKIHQQQDQEGD